jgi:hypothetical protein
VAGLSGLHALGAVLARDRLELLMERELLDERVAHVGIVVDDQNPAGTGHCAGLAIRPRGRGKLRSRPIGE